MSRFPQHPKDHPVIGVIQKLDLNIREGLMDKDESMNKFDELCSDPDEHVRYYAAWYVIHQYKDTELHDKAALLLLEPLVKVLDETEPLSGNLHLNNEEELNRFYTRRDIIREMQKIGSLQAIQHLQKLNSDTEEYDAWGMDVFISIAEIAQDAIDRIKVANNKA